MQTLVAGPLPKLQKFGTNISNAERLFNKLFHDPMEGEESPAVSPENSPERQSQEEVPEQQSQEDDPPPEFYLRSLSSTIGSPPPDFVPRRSTRTTRPPERLQIGERPKLKPNKRRSTSCGPLTSAPAAPPESDNDMDISIQPKHPWALKDISVWQTKEQKRVASTICTYVNKLLRPLAFVDVCALK